jgi:zinc transporter ZupT
MDTIHAIVIALIPSSAMAMSSMLLIFFDSFETSKAIESSSQSLCAGLIMAAVAVELFPILMDNPSIGLTDAELLISVFCGFAIAISFLYGVGWIAGSFDADNDNDNISVKVLDQASKERSAKLIELSPHAASYQSLSGSDSPVSADHQDWEEQEVVIATEAIAAPGHRAKIRESAVDVSNSIRSIDTKMGQIFSMEGRPVLSTFREELTEDIDKEVHLLQYKIDHVRRLLEGSGAEISPAHHLPTESWLNENNKKRIHRNMSLLKILCSNIIDDLDNHQNISTIMLQEMHGHIQNMDSILTKLHNKVSMASYRWKKRNAVKGPIPAMGSIIPISLVVPVVVDAMVDGFLIGLSSSISLRVGFILASANAIEMSFLGIAVSMRIRKCTGSNILLRYLSLLTPPLVMCLFTFVGMFCGAAAAAHAPLFVMFVSFGIVALLSLACNELLWESRQAVGGEDTWQNTMILFVGVFLIIVMDKIQPDER